MPLDFHLAKTKKQALYESALDSFDELTHGIMFERSNALPAKQFPLFHRMQDYYGDAHFTHAEIATLQTELAQLLDIFSKHSAIVAQIYAIHVLCEKALEEGMSIWVFCD